MTTIPGANWRDSAVVAAPGGLAALAFSPLAADIAGGRLAVDEPLANRVRSGRKQP